MLERKLFAVGDLDVDVLQGISCPAKFGEEHALRALEFSIGGNAANFAVIAAKLGLQPVLVSVIGSDFATPFLLSELAKAKVTTSLVKSRQKNAFSSIAVDMRGERAIQSIKNCLLELTSAKAVQLLLPKLRAGDIVLFGGFFHVANMRKGFPQLLKKIRNRGAITCFDTCFDRTGRRGISAFLPFFDILFTNETELKHVAKGKTTGARASFLLRKGCRCVVLKQGAKGATLFTQGAKPIAAKGLKVKAVDSTGAGDAFNAGFAFGLLRNWSMRNCLLAANFVAARKVQQHGLAAPTAKAVERFVAVHNKPMLLVEKNYAVMSKTAALILIDLLRQKPDASLALATGETPKLLYKILVSKYKKGEIDFGKAKFFAIDEYAGLEQSDGNSFSYYLRHRLLDKINAKKQNIFLLNGAARNLKMECAKHEAAIRRQGIDLCILGIGRNGHVAFNEPGSCPYGSTRVVRLKQQTRKVNGKNFTSGLAPAKAITIGLRTIRENSKAVLLLAGGKHKSKAIAATLHSKDFLRWPAVALKPHKNFVFVADKEAAAMA